MEFLKDPKNRKVITFFVIAFVIAGGLTIVKHVTGHDKPKADTLQEYYDQLTTEKEMLFADFQTKDDAVVSGECEIKDNEFIVNYTYKKQQSKKEIKKCTDMLEENGSDLQKQAEEVIKGLRKKTGIKPAMITMTLNYYNKDGTPIWSESFTYK